jgi:hypothetical protein
MATTLTTTTFGTTYKDDFQDSDRYYKILFNAGRAIQARELTQMQTITHAEIERFGRNLFVEGAPIRGGNLHLVRYHSLALDTSTYNLPANLEWIDLVGSEFTGTSPAIKFKVLMAFGPSPRNDGSGLSNPPTLFIEYTDTTSGTAGANSIKVANGATFANATLALTLQAAATDATGIGTKAVIAPGEFFVKGHFVFAQGQTIILNKYKGNFNTELGFRLIEDVVTAPDNDALYDNQGETPNEAAPGADRYRIKLDLVDKRTISANDSFVYLATIVNGEISRQVTKVDGYNTIYDLIAERTKEESGNYTVDPIIAKFNDISGNDSTMELEISSGTAYVDGYRLELPKCVMEIPKARDTLVQNNQAIIVQYGNYVIGDNATNAGLPDIHQLAQVNLRSATGYGGSTIGTARVRAIEEDNSGDSRYYLFDIQMSAGQNFRDARSFGSGVSDYVNIVLEDGIAALKSTANNSLLFDLPSKRPTLTGISDLSMTVQVRYTFTGTGATLTAPGTNDIFTNTGDWILSTTTGSIETGATYTLTGVPTGNQVTVSGVPSGTYELITYVALDGANINIRQKTLEASQNITTAWPGGAITDANGNQYIDLGYADVYNVERIRTVDSDGEDLTENFTFDNGQRDNFYAKSRLIAKPGVTIPTGNIYTKFRRFSHGTGDFFAANSYNGAVSYSNIPNHTKSNGQVINLRDVLDFRPVQATDGTYTGTGGVINPLPQNTDVIRADVEYYLPRKDKLLVAIDAIDRSTVKFGVYTHLAGTSAIKPQAPATPPSTMALYDITLKPFTLDRNDVVLEYINNRNYTMRDIGELETRINDVVELTTLSLLENETATINVLDSAGNPRTKAGFLADNFADYTFSDTLNTSYRASIDQGQKELTPNFNEKNVRIVYDADNAGNTANKVGDYLILPYTEESFIYNDLATRVLSVNPAGFITNTGSMKLSPSSDQWFETEYVAEVVIDKGDVTSTDGSITVRSRNDTQYAWYGTSNKIITSTNTVRKLVEEKTVEQKFIPYMRSIKIHFKAQGLRPNTRHFPFFNNKLVSDWCRSEASYINFSDTSNDYGSSLNAASGHPDGATTLISDATGTINGSFVIPATDALKFKTGEVIFKLLDISADDDASSSSSAFASFASTGIINVNQKTFQTTRHVKLATSIVKTPPRYVSTGGGSGNDGTKVTITTGNGGYTYTSLTLNNDNFYDYPDADTFNTTVTDYESEAYGVGSVSVDYEYEAYHGHTSPATVSSTAASEDANSGGDGGGGGGGDAGAAGGENDNTSGPF